MGLGAKSEGETSGGSNRRNSPSMARRAALSLLCASFTSPSISLLSAASLLMACSFCSSRSRTRCMAVTTRACVA
jgi:hypothetical protein